MPTPSPERRRAESPTWRRSPLYRWLRHPLVYWSAVALLVVASVAAATRQSDRQRDFEAAYGELRQVPVAAGLIRPGEPLDAGSVQWEARPAAAVPPGTAGDLADGAVAAAAIYPGEVVHTERVAGLGGGLSSRLAPDVAAVSVPTTYGVPPVRPGDSVSLVAVFDSFATDSAPVAQTVAHHATVLDLDEEAVTVAIRASELEATVSALVWGAVTVVAVGTFSG
ncbi:MAG: SAF domain-containing protein [bacterium]|nr:SAF domain-containing protein [bacterium]